MTVTDPRQEAAETLALQAAAFIFSDEDLMNGFVGLTGADPQDVKENLGDPCYLAGVLEYLLSREEELVQFCEAQDINPEQPKWAWVLLSGGPQEEF